MLNTSTFYLKNKILAHYRVLSHFWAGTACDYITLNFELQDGSCLESVVQREVSDCISLYQNQFQTPRRGSFQVFLYEREAGTACEKGLLAQPF